MTRAWLQKELRDHWLALTAWLAFAAALYGLMLFGLSQDQARGSWLEAPRRFAIGWSLLGTTYLAGRLIRREYNSRTQLFLEALPVSRTRVLTTKLVMGAALTAGVFGVAIGIATAIGGASQAHGPRLLAFVSVRVLSVAWFVWALLAMAALLGRYRIPLLLVLGLALTALAQFTSLELTNLGPARLLGDELPYEDAVLPWAALAQTWAGTALCLGACYALVLAGDGLLTVQLSDRMSHREKVYVTCVLLAFLVGLGTLEATLKPEPFRLSDAVVAEKNGTRVEVSAELEPAFATELADGMLRILESAREEVGLTQLPGLALLPTRELDPDEAERAHVANASGVVLRAALDDPELDSFRLTMVALHDVLSEARDDRAMKETSHWLLDGFAHLHTARQLLGEEGVALLWLRAAVIPAQPLEPFLRRWDPAQEELGTCLSGAAAASVLLTVETLAGPQALQRLVRRVLDENAQRSWLVADPALETLLQEEAGLTVAAVEQAWTQRLEAVRREHPDVLEPLRAARPELELRRLSGRTFELRHRLTLSPPPEESLRYSVRFGALGPMDVPENENDFQLQQAQVGSGAFTALPPALVEGSRWMWVVDLPSPSLRCSVRVLAQRREIR
ncbi:MAG: hypothetical protein M3Y59_07390 [Myxococcota bacterium]|nr:hypothetical protein [Myxococcota bacterium]